MAEDLRSSAPGTFGQIRLAAAAITFADGTVKIDDLAVGDVVTRIWVEVLTAFNAGTTNVLTAGTGSGANGYVGSAAVTEGTPGVYPTDGAAGGPFAAITSATTLNVKYAQTGTAATTGSAKAYAIITSLPA